MILAIVLLITFAVSFTLTHVARRIAPKIGFIDAPDGARKQHVKPTPVLGGAAIYFSLLAIFVLGLVFKIPWLENADYAPGLIASCSLFFFLGLIDDKRPLSARHKFIGQIIASLPFAIYAGSIDKVGMFGFDVTLGQWGILLTILWLVTCSNIINLIDGLDGLASSVSIVVLLTIGAIAWSHGNSEVAWFGFVVCAAICGFLIHNLPPARIFLGDSGALMLGFLVGAFAIESAVKRAAVFTMIGTLVMVSVPFFDTVVAMVRRKLRGQGIGEADRGHIHHRLQDLGLSRKQTLGVMVALSIVMAIVAVLADTLRNDFIAVLLCFSLLASLVIGRVFGHYEAVMMVRHIKAICSLSYDLLRMSGSRVLMVRLQDREVTRDQNAWDMICARIASQGIHSLEFTCRNTDNELTGCLQWKCETVQPGDVDDWVLHFSANVDTDTNSSLVVSGSSKRAEALRAANDLFIFCNALCKNQAVIQCAMMAYEANRDVEVFGHILQFDIDRIEDLAATRQGQGRSSGIRKAS